MPFDLDAVRAQTPGLPRGSHLLACSSALMPQVVADAITDHILLEDEIDDLLHHLKAHRQAAP